MPAWLCKSLNLRFPESYTTEKKNTRTKGLRVMPEKYREIDCLNHPDSQCVNYLDDTRLQNHPPFSMEIGNDFLMAVVSSALSGPQASQVKFTDSRTQWVMTIVSNTLLFSSKELTCPEITILFGNRAFGKFMKEKKKSESRC